MKYIQFVFFTLIFSSCSSVFYSSNEKVNNNQFIISSNVPIKLKSADNFNYPLKSTEIKDPSSGRYENSNSLEKLNKKSRTIVVSRENYDPDTILIRKSPRVKGVLMNYFAFFMLIPIDILRSDFYKISKNSKYIEVDLRLSQKFLFDRLQRITINKNLDSLNKFIVNYSYYNEIDNVIHLRDSLKFYNVVSLCDESKMDKFIRENENSEYIDQAKQIKSSYKVAREKFNEIKFSQNSELFYNYLIKYPNSLQRIEATNILLNLEFKKAIALNSIDGYLKFNKKYLLSFGSTISSKNDTFFNKSKFISYKIDNALGKEFYSKTGEKYSNFIRFWNLYLIIRKENKNLYFFPNCSRIKSSIADYLLTNLSKIKKDKSQNDFLKKCLIDFPDFQISSSGNVDTSIHYITEIISNAKEFSGKLSLMNQGLYSNLINHLPETHTLMNLVGFDYKKQSYSNFKRANREDIEFINGKLSGITLFENNDSLCSSALRDKQFEIHYYLYGGKKVKSYYFENGYGYFYEFENGVNITLLPILNIIRDAEITESINYQMSNESLLQNNYELLNKYQRAKNNKLPENHPINLKINSSITRLNNARINIQKRIQEDLESRKEKERQDYVKIQNERNQTTLNSKIKGIYQGYLNNRPLDMYILFDKQGVALMCLCEDYENILLRNSNISKRTGLIKDGTYIMNNGVLTLTWADGKSTQYLYISVFNQISSMDGRLIFNCVRSNF